MIGNRAWRGVPLCLHIRMLSAEVHGTVQCRHSGKRHLSKLWLPPHQPTP